MEHVFSGNIYIFHSFDVGEDVNLEKIKESNVVAWQPLKLQRYFKNYHIPLAIRLPSNQNSPKCVSCRIHNFGAISLTYKVPFTKTFDTLRAKLNSVESFYQKQSVNDVDAVFRKVKPFIAKPKFFQTRSSYLVIQVDPEPNFTDVVKLKENYGSIIASTLRFETQSLSEYQKNDILDGAIGYFRGDLIIIDTDAAFVYDDEYEELLDLFEFANIQHLEMRYFDRLLDQHLNAIYEGRVRALSPKAYLPLISAYVSDPVSDLGRVKVDISVITERLESSIKLVGEPYYSELYDLLYMKLDLKNWRESIDKKLSIVRDIYAIHRDKVDGIREDLLTVVIILLIFIEVLLGLGLLKR
jgi:hypothetical protein